MYCPWISFDRIFCIMLFLSNSTVFSISLHLVLLFALLLSASSLLVVLLFSVWCCGLLMNLMFDELSTLSFILPYSQWLGTMLTRYSARLSQISNANCSYFRSFSRYFSFTLPSPGKNMSINQIFLSFLSLIVTSGLLVVVFCRGNSKSQHTFYLLSQLPYSIILL